MSEPAPHRSVAMARLAEREAASGGAGVSQHGGFEASVHRIKEQVLPRLHERVAPEAAETLSKEVLTEECRTIIGEALAELKLTTNRREKCVQERGLVDELLGQGWLGAMWSAREG